MPPVNKNPKFQEVEALETRKLKPLSTAQRTAIVATLAASVGATGGVALESLQDPEIVTIEEVINYQEDLMQRGEKPEQFLPGGQNPDDSNRRDQFSGIGENVRVNVYESPKGGGYQVITKYDDRTVSVGYGAEADERTWIKDSDGNVISGGTRTEPEAATSTPSEEPEPVVSATSTSTRQ